MSLFVNGKIVEYKEGIKVIDLVDKSDKNIISCKVNNKLRDLSYCLKDNSHIELLGFDDEDSIRVYEASLRYLFVMAVNKAFPFYKVSCDYYVSRSICFKVLDGEFSFGQFEIIKNTMEELVKGDFEFVRETVSLDKAKKYYDSNGFQDKVEVFGYRPEKTVHLYKCDNYINYMYSYMVPSTGYLNKYNLIFDKGLIILQYQ